MHTTSLSTSLVDSLPHLRRKSRRQLTRRKRLERERLEAPSVALPTEGSLDVHDNSPKKGVRVLGPYPNGPNFRLVVIDGAKRKSITAPTLEEAEALKNTLAGEIQTHRDRTIAEALAEYIDHRVRDCGIVALTVCEINRLTDDFLPASSSLTAITPQVAEKLYRTLTLRKTPRGTVLSPSTHHVLLGRARAFFRWTVEQGYMIGNPFANVHPIGHKRVGKTQLTIHEARRFKDLALQQANDGDVAALGVLMLLLLGLRAGEVLAREARDVDDEVRVLWITRGKTKNARRRLEVPDEIQEPLRKLISGKAPSELIFGTNRAGGRRNKAYLWFKVQGLCQAAGVPHVCSHSLRGLHSTLALEAGATPHLVAAALGHSSFKITARHYAEPSTLLNTRSRRANGALGNSAQNSGETIKQNEDLGALLNTLSLAQREQLHELLSRSKEHVQK